MHFILLPSLFMLAVFALTAYAVWCCFCFTLGHWFVKSICGRRHRSVSRPWETSPRMRLEATPPPSPHLQRPQHEGNGGSPSPGRSSGFGLILALIVAILVLFGYHARSSQSLYSPAIEPPVKSEMPVQLSVDQKPAWFTGRGKTRADAEEVALNDACSNVRSYLRDQLHVRWNPSPLYFQKYVRTQMVKDVKYEGTREVPDLGTVHEVSLRVEISPESRKDLLRRDRLVLFAQLLGIVVVLLGTVAVYIRFDELSKGYYTSWLRLGAIGVAGASCVGWWLVTFGS